MSDIMSSYVVLETKVKFSCKHCNHISDTSIEGKQWHLKPDGGIDYSNLDLQCDKCKYNDVRVLSASTQPIFKYSKIFDGITGINSSLLF